MNTILDPSVAAGYRSPSQIARKITEAWAKENLYCVVCDSQRVAQTENNAEAVDFRCETCSSGYQLKSLRSRNDHRIPDAGYYAMMRALQSDSVPNLLVMHYTTHWEVQKLMIIPSFFFTAAAIERRKPLGPRARRAGWIGCNILLNEIAPDGKILMISDGNPISRRNVRAQYNFVRPFGEMDNKLRGWTLDVFRMVRQIKKGSFTLDEVYSFENKLALLYPNNKNIKPKIRQQLQILRDAGFVKFLGNGQYKILSEGPG